MIINMTFTISIIFEFNTIHVFRLKSYDNHSFKTGQLHISQSLLTLVIILYIVILKFIFLI